MHMADALVSPAVGGTMWVVSAGLIGWCARKLKSTVDDQLIPMMGVLGAFVFTAQMINFTIPATGSSGHLGGGLLLAAILGPHAAFLVIASVLTVQALFFADGGLLALGCNIFNLGFFPAFVAYPLIYRIIVKNVHNQAQLWGGSILAAVIGLQLGAFAVVLETVASGISELPFGKFLLLMQPIHLAIGIVEGLATAAVVLFVARVRPEVLEDRKDVRPLRPVLVGLLIASLLLGGVISWFASGHLDGLEWSIEKTSGHPELETADAPVYSSLETVQSKTAFLPDYGFPAGADSAEAAEEGPVNLGTSVSGIVGGGITLAMAALIGYILTFTNKKE
jgi:cobalt/nickel transport system permease protein